MRSEVRTCLLLALLTAAAQAAPLAEFRCEERLGRDWRTMPVTYAVAFGPGLVRESAVRLLDAEGQPVPCQFTRVARHPDGTIRSARLVFRAALPPRGSYAFRLEPGAPAAAATVGVTRGPDGLTLDSGPFAVRLPPEGEAPFPLPRPLLRQAGAEAAPGPLQGFRLHGGEWVGGSHFAADDAAGGPALLGLACTVTEHGALFTEATVVYRLDNDRSYRFTLRLSPGDTAAWVDEQFDLREVGRTRRWQEGAPRDPMVVFALSGGDRPGGWKPDHIFWERQPYGSGVQPQQTPLERTLVQRPGFDFTKPAFGTHALPYDAAAAGAVVGVEPWAVFGNYVYYAGLVQAAQVAAEEAPPFVGVMPVHAGNWRSDGPYAFKWLATTPAGAVTWSLPLVAHVHPNRSVHTGEYDPELPYTFGRRQWVLFGGPLKSLQELNAFRRYEGYINLDDYKEWVLAWPADPSVAYPRLFCDKADIDRVRPALAAAGEAVPPPASALREWLTVDDDPKRSAELYARLAADRGYWSSALGQINADLDYWFPLWRQGHAASQWIPGVEELLASAHLDEAQRQTLRAQLAAMASLAAEPDYGPRGSMAHLGNPNMAIVRFMPLLYAAALIPDHPQAGGWLDTMTRFFEYKLFSNTGPGGGWSELFSYYDASAPTLVHAANILDRMGRLSPTARTQVLELAAQTLHFHAPTDPRSGLRAVPEWGHEGRGANYGHWLPAMRLAASGRPDLAAGFAWCWAQSGFPLGHHDAGFSTRCLPYVAGAPTPQAPPPGLLRSRWTPGLGAALRAHAGDRDETFLSYRQGYFISHCDDNQGDFVLFSKGAPLVDMSLFAYPLHQHDPFIALNAQFGWYSTPRLSPQNVASDMRQGANNRNLIGAWNPSSDVHAHAFDVSVDYLRGRADYPPHCWSRQILFLKGNAARSPNYFVFRDSFDLLPGAVGELKPYWWNLRTVGPAAQVRPVAGGFDYASPYGPRLLVRFPALGRLPIETHAAERVYNKTTNTLSVSAAGPIDAGRDTIAVLYPAAAEEQSPRITAVADGVVRVETAEATDWVFVDRRSVDFTSGDVGFRGRAGAVRIHADTVHLVVAEGPGEVRYRGVTLRSDIPATRIIPLMEVSTSRRIDVAAPPHAIRFEPPAGVATELAPGVRRIALADGFALVFDAVEPLDYSQEGVWFRGRRGGIVVNTAEGTVRLAVLDGDGAGAGAAAAWNGIGPYDLTFHRDRISGRHAGGGRSINVSLPAGVDRYATVVVDGIPCLPGSSLTTDPAVAGRGGPDPDRVGQALLVIPLQDGEHAFEVRNLEQAPVFRNWQAW